MNWNPDAWNQDDWNQDDWFLSQAVGGSNTCLIAEFAGVQTDGQGRDMPIAKSLIRIQSVLYGTAIDSLPFSDKCKLIRIISDADVYIAFGATATATGIRIPANFVEYFGVEQGGFVSCYDGSS